MTIKELSTKLRMHNLPVLLQMVLNICLIGMALVLSVLLIYETWSIFSLIFLSTNSSDTTVSYYQFTDELLVFFLYFEFLALIIKYFEANFHFPLRYFIYIGITAIIRLIIVDHDDAMHTLGWSLAIVVLVGALFLSNLRQTKESH